MLNNKFNITPTVRRNAFWNAMVILAMFIVFNLFSLFILNFHLQEEHDSKIKHEAEHVLLAIEYVDSTINVLNPHEFRESDLAEITEDPFFVQVYDLNGDILLQSKNVSLFEPIPIEFPKINEQYTFFDLDVENEKLRTAYCKIFDEDGIHKAFLQISAINFGVNKLTRYMVYFNLISFPIVLIIVYLVSIFLAKRGLNRINNIIDLANEISATNLSERIVFETTSDDELGKLKDTLNLLFARLEKQVNSIADFTDNASHQLLSPLTTIKSELNYILNENRSRKDFLESVAVLSKETNRMIDIVKTLLLLAKECNECGDTTTVFNISKLMLKNIAALYKPDPVKFDIKSELFVRGKSDFFSLAITNIINNALKYSNNEDVFVDLFEENEKVILLIKDSGLGIPNEIKTKIFEKFFRDQKLSELNIEGSGLGLSLAQSVIDAMKGEIIVSDNFPKGSIFRIELPAIKMD